MRSACSRRLPCWKCFWLFYSELVDMSTGVSTLTICLLVLLCVTTTQLSYGEFHQAFIHDFWMKAKQSDSSGIVPSNIADDYPVHGRFQGPKTPPLRFLADCVVRGCPPSALPVLGTGKKRLKRKVFRRSRSAKTHRGYGLRTWRVPGTVTSLPSIALRGRLKAFLFRRFFPWLFTANFV